MSGYSKEGKGRVGRAQEGRGGGREKRTEVAECDSLGTMKVTKRVLRPISLPLPCVSGPRSPDRQTGDG